MTEKPSIITVTLTADQWGSIINVLEWANCDHDDSYLKDLVAQVNDGLPTP